MKLIPRMSVFALLVLAGTSGNALAEEHDAARPADEKSGTGMYIGASGGISFPSKVSTELAGLHNLDDSFVVNGAIGYNFVPARVEAALGFHKYDCSDEEKDISFITLMANACYDIDTGSLLVPYVMGGIGIADIDLSTTGENKTVFAWQVGAGLGMEVTDGVTVDVGYRYLKPSEFETPTRGDAKMHVSDISVGVRYQF